MDEQEVKEIKKLIYGLQPKLLIGDCFYDLLPEEWESLIVGSG